MKRIVIAIVMILFVVVGIAYALDRSTGKDAKAMLEKAIAFYQANGQEKALATFNDPNGPFVKKDLYIFALDLNGKVIAHGTNAGLIGKGMQEIRDLKKKNFINVMVKIAKAKGEGTVDYWWDNPQSRAGEQKISYFKKIDGVILGCGYYKVR